MRYVNNTNSSIRTVSGAAQTATPDTSTTTSTVDQSTTTGATVPKLKGLQLAIAIVAGVLFLANAWAAVKIIKSKRV